MFVMMLIMLMMTNHLTAVLMVDSVPVTHWRRLVLSHVRLRYIEPGHYYQGQIGSDKYNGIKYFVVED